MLYLSLWKSGTSNLVPSLQICSLKKFLLKLIFFGTTFSGCASRDSTSSLNSPYDSGIDTPAQKVRFGGVGCISGVSCYYYKTTAKMLSVLWKLQGPIILHSTWNFAPKIWIKLHVWRIVTFWGLIVCEQFCICRNKSINSSIHPKLQCMKMKEIWNERFLPTGYLDYWNDTVVIRDFFT